MTSPIEEFAVPFAADVAVPQVDARDSEIAFGEDEERLVQRANQEAALRLARAL